MAYLSSDLLNAVMRYSAVPQSQVTFQNTDFYALADDSIRAKIVPLVTSAMEEFYVYEQNTPIAANQSIYPIPYRAIGMKLRSVQVVSTANQDIRVNLERLNPDDLYTSISGSKFRVQKSGFYIEGNNVVLYPSVVQGADNLRLNYLIRPNQLVDPSVCAQITAINFSTNQVTCSGGVPSTWTTSNLVDTVKAQPGFDCTTIDQPITNINSGVITFANVLPSTLSVGDWVCLAGTSCVVQVPVELQPLLTQYVVIRVLTAQGDQNALKAALNELEALEKNASLLLTPRVQGNVRRVTNGRPISRLV